MVDMLQLPDFILNQEGIKEMELLYWIFIYKCKEEKMKRTILFIFFIIGILAFADSDYKNSSRDKILENKIENTLNYKFKVLKDSKRTIRVNEYDVDVANNYLEVKVEVNSHSDDFNYEKALVPVRNEVLNMLPDSINYDINVVVEYDKIMGEDEIVYMGSF